MNTSINILKVIIFNIKKRKTTKHIQNVIHCLGNHIHPRKKKTINFISKVYELFYLLPFILNCQPPTTKSNKC